jgi:hypothetical protein
MESAPMESSATAAPNAVKGSATARNMAGFAYYNFCRVHGTLRRTPAMASGITNHAFTFVSCLRKKALQGK